MTTNTLLAQDVSQDTNQADTATPDNVVPISIHQEEKKEKKYNGYLRNSNRKNKKPAEHVVNETPKSVTSPNKNKPTLRPVKKNNHNNHRKPTHVATSFVEEDEISNLNREDVFSAESLLFAFLRQKTGTNPVAFWQNLQEVLKEKTFAEVSRSDMSLVSYSALYEYNDIFENLIHEYGTQVSQSEFEQSIFPICMNKNSHLLQHAISFYEKTYSPDNLFLTSILTKACKISYREENNCILLQWLSPFMTQEHCQTFWQECLEQNNVVMLECALTIKALHTYLKQNYHNHEAQILSINKKHTVEKLLSLHVDATPKLQMSERTVSIPEVSSTIVGKTESTWLGNSEENFKALQNEEKIHKTEVVIKKKKKVL